MNEELKNRILAKPLARRGRGDLKRKRDDPIASPASAKKGSTSSPIQLDEEEPPLPTTETREPSPDLPMAGSGGDGDGGEIPGRRRLRHAIQAGPVAVVTANPPPTRPLPLPTKPPQKSKGKEVQSAGADVTWKSGQTVESFVEEVQKEVKGDVANLNQLMKDPKFFRYWVKQLAKSVYVAASVGMANAQGGDLEEKLLDQVQKTSEESAKVAKLEKALEAEQMEVALGRSRLEAIKVELDELKPKYTDLVAKADALSSDIAAIRKDKSEATTALRGLQAKYRLLEQSEAVLKGKLEGANQLLAEKDEALVAEGATLRQSGYDTGYDDGYAEARAELLERFAQVFPDLDPAGLETQAEGGPGQGEGHGTGHIGDVLDSGESASRAAGPNPVVVETQDLPLATGDQDSAPETGAQGPTVTAIGEEQAGDDVA